MSQVAASPAEIKTVLVKDTGLMVELKRWVAKDATDHGQIISEADLTDDAIFNRLETDVMFRSIATQFLQRYGYLVPKVNPDSAAGKEQELLIAERVKWIAQQEEDMRTQERAKAEQASQQARACSQTQIELRRIVLASRQGSGSSGQRRPAAGKSAECSDRKSQGASPSQTNPISTIQPNQPNLPNGNRNPTAASAQFDAIRRGFGRPFVRADARWLA